MQGVYGGLVVIISYASNSGTDADDEYLITQSNLDILTQTSERIFVQE